MYFSIFCTNLCDFPVDFHTLFHLILMLKILAMFYHFNQLFFIFFSAAVHFWFLVIRFIILSKDKRIIMHLS